MYMLHQMQDFEYLFEKKRILRGILELPTKNVHLINRVCTTFETLADREREQGTTTLYGKLTIYHAVISQRHTQVLYCKGSNAA